LPVDKLFDTKEVDADPSKEAFLLHHPVQKERIFLSNLIEISLVAAWKRFSSRVFGEVEITDEIDAQQIGIWLLLPASYRLERSPDSSY